MPLKKIKALLNHATDNGYGVLAVNTFNVETIKWVIMAAELEKVPVIVQFYPGFDASIRSSIVAHAAKVYAEEAAVDVAVHNDHSVTYELAVKGIRDGFPSVMVDGSKLNFEENVRLTQDVIRAARVFGVEVEAELGHVGSGANIEHFANADNFTDAEQAREFVARTGCDLLAVAVGNAHGAYTQTPNLDFARIRDIRRAVDVPLVLHGSSDIPDAQMKEAVRQGISKFNVATEYFRAFYHALEANMHDRKHKDAYAFIRGAEEKVLAFLRAKMRLVRDV